MEPRRILRTKAAADYLGLAAGTLEKARLEGSGPPFVKITDRMIGYDLRDLDQFIEARKLTSTSARPRRGE